jgi:hypothetical protein
VGFFGQVRRSSNTLVVVHRDEVSATFPGASLNSVEVFVHGATIDAHLTRRTVLLLGREQPGKLPPGTEVGEVWDYATHEKVLVHKGHACHSRDLWQFDHAWGRFKHLDSGRKVAMKEVAEVRADALGRHAELDRATSCVAEEFQAEPMPRALVFEDVPDCRHV